jgi:hypothetical protein
MRLPASASTSSSDRLEAVEMRFLRSVIGITRRDKNRNDDIKNKRRTESLKDTTNKYRENWRNHVQSE